MIDLTNFYNDFAENVKFWIFVSMVLCRFEFNLTRNDCVVANVEI